MNIWLALTFIFALLEAVAVSKNLPKLEYIAKPGVLVYLFLWLYFSTNLQGDTFWFGVGLLFALLGDVILLNPSNTMFLFGLVAFLFTHIFYITGFKGELVTGSAWSLLLVVFLAINATRLLRRIIGAMRAKGESGLTIPVMIYGIIISMMLYGGLSTLYDPAWKTSAALLVSLGALLFWTSDLILAWNKFVSPIKNGTMWNITLYYLGQIGLIAGVISQFR
ncbi:MAG TPA: lysoplasmalogenase [Anaerolineales bacterium]|nr:lysoplasmalogenase [Anaerolineales bacterium]